MSNIILHRDWLNDPANLERIADVAAGGVKPATIVRFALRALQKTPRLAECNRNSLLLALLDASACGLEPDGRKGHLVPFGKDVVFVPGYQGLIDRMRQGGAIRDIWTAVVYACDEFAWEMGDEPRLKHVPNPEHDEYGDMGKARGVYACVKLADGTVHREYMPAKAVRAIKAGVLARGKDRPSPWKVADNEGEMWRKTAVRRVAKYIPYLPDIAELLMHIDESERASEARRVDAEVLETGGRQALTDRIMALPAAEPQPWESPSVTDERETVEVATVAPAAASAPEQKQNGVAQKPARPVPTTVADMLDMSRDKDCAAVREFADDMPPHKLAQIIEAAKPGARRWSDIPAGALRSKAAAEAVAWVKSLRELDSDGDADNDEPAATGNGSMFPGDNAGHDA